MAKLLGISEEIDSCAGLITQSANRTYRRIAPEHKRWIDPEDILQDGLLAAVLSQKKYNGLQVYERCMPTLQRTCQGKYVALVTTPPKSPKPYKFIGPF